jgi:phosphodiesterase/alkaline phosphatase D-like protein
MCRISFWLLIVAAMAATGSDCMAAGSFQTKPAFQSGVTTGTVSPTSSVSGSTGSTNELGCGRGRVRDPQTHTCRGPADVR